MRAIQHVRSSYWAWFRDPDYFKSRADHILWIGRQESLDLKPLAASLGLERLELPTDPREANMAIGPRPDLSDLARQNLREWFEKDYMFLELCEELGPEHDWQALDGRDTGRTFVGRAMSERPFALRNADAFRLARIARAKKHVYRRWLYAHTPFLPRR